MKYILILSVLLIAMVIFYTVSGMPDHYLGGLK